ncbi:hypothetical protein C2G38_2229126 [Gigaspora rosea]|uniref:Uncharacterized protein n=1 Tax=Gigaspora rosea TaxID=44941 RepID=A0A397U3J1_9GLOM|nr:hypothetical protein C2G38_2229126 [Gigaspora rosea]
MANKQAQSDDSTDSSKIDTDKNTELSTMEAGFTVRIMELERNSKESSENEKRSQIENSELKVLEQSPYLSLKYSNKNCDYFDFNSSVSCPICNKDNKKENIKYNIEGEWGSWDYVNTKTYHLKCCETYQNSIQIVTVKA